MPSARRPKPKIEAKGGTCEVIGAKKIRARPRPSHTGVNHDRHHRQYLQQLLQDSGTEVPDFVHLAVLAICRLAAIDSHPGFGWRDAVELFRSKAHGRRDRWGMYSMFTGGALENCAIGALGIMPYISATIIMQLLTAVMPQLSKLAREEGGRTKIIQYGRYLTVLLCLGQGIAHGDWAGKIREQLFSGLIRASWFLLGFHLVLSHPDRADPDDGNDAVDVARRADHRSRHWQRSFAHHHHRHSGALAAGGSGLLDMFFPAAATRRKSTRDMRVALLLLLAGVIAGVIAITQAQRKIPVQYAQRAVGRKVYSGGTSFMPLRVNYAGVMPIIFAQAILMFPQMIFRICLAAKATGATFFWRPRARHLSYGACSLHGALHADDFVLLVFLGGDAVQ